MSAKTIRAIQGRAALCIGEPERAAPRGWQWVRLDEVAKLESGHTPSRSHSEYWDGEVPWVSIPDARVHHGGTIEHTRQTITEEGLANSSARLLPAGTVCLSRTASVGYVVVLGREMATSQDFVDWVCGPAIEPRFLQYVLLAEGDDIRRFGKGTTHITIYFEAAEEFRVCLPPLAEQRRIVAALDEMLGRVRAVRASLDEAPALLERARQAVLAAAFRGELTADWRAAHPAVEDAAALLARIRAERRHTRKETELPNLLEGDDALPSGWACAALGELAANEANSMTDGPFGSNLKSEHYTDDGVRVVRLGNIGIGRFVDDDAAYISEEHAERLTKHRCFAGDLLIAALAEPVGRCAKVPDDLGPAIVKADCIRMKPTGAISTAMLMHYLNSPPGLRRTAEASHGIGRLRINLGELRALTVPLPPLDEQHEIVRRVEAALAKLDAVTAAVEATRTQLDAIERAVLAKAFRGELVAQDPADEPAEALLARLRAARAAGEKPAKRRGRSAG